MKVAISACGTDINSEINPRFGRCDYILIIDTDTQQVEALANENMNAGGGAGIQTAGMVVSKGATAVITGSCGPNAMDVFTSSGVDVYTGQTGTVGQAIERFNKGELAPSMEANAAEKAGMAGMAGGAGAPSGNAGVGAGGGSGCRRMGGQGMGRGGGGGRGRGMGMGMGSGMGRKQ